MTRNEILNLQGVNCLHKAGLWQKEFFNNSTILDLGEELLNCDSKTWLKEMTKRGYDPADHRSIAPILGLTSIESREGDEDMFITSIYQGHNTAIVSGPWFHAADEGGALTSEWSRFTPKLQKKLNFYLFRINHG